MLRLQNWIVMARAIADNETTCTILNAASGYYSNACTFLYVSEQWSFRCHVRYGMFIWSVGNGHFPSKLHVSGDCIPALLQYSKVWLYLTWSCQTLDAKLTACVKSQRVNQKIVKTGNINVCMALSSKLLFFLCMCTIFLISTFCLERLHDCVFILLIAHFYPKWRLIQMATAFKDTLRYCKYG